MYLSLIGLHYNKSVYVFYFMNLNAFLWYGVSTFHRTLKGVMAQKTLRTPAVNNAYKIIKHYTTVSQMALECVCDVSVSIYTLRTAMGI